MRLLSIDLSQCLSVGDSGLLHVAQLCPDLRHLRLVGMGDTCGDRGIAALARGCALLVSLDVTGMVLLSDGGMRAVAMGMGQLRNLSLAGCTSLTDGGVRALVRSPDLRASLSRVDLSGCTDLTDVSAKVLLDNCEALEELGVSGCDRMSREEFGLDLVEIRKRYPQTVLRCAGERLAAMYDGKELEKRSQAKSKVLKRFPEPKKPFVSPSPFPGLGFRGGRGGKGGKKGGRGKKKKKK